MEKNFDFLIKKKKQALLMDLFTVFIILISCFIVIIFLYQSTELSASLVSPVPVLEIDDQRILFETSEYLLLREVYCNNIYANEMKKQFCLRFNDLEAVDFLLRNTIPTRDFNLQDNDFCTQLYSFEKNHAELEVIRIGIKKQKILTAEKNNFDVFFSFNLKKQYLLTRDDCS